MTISVTEADIANGRRFDPYMCMVVLAAERVLGGNIVVSDKRLHVYDDRWRRVNSFDLPLNAQDAIRRFDEGKAVHPFSLFVSA